MGVRESLDLPQMRGSGRRQRECAEAAYKRELGRTYHTQLNSHANRRYISFLQIIYGNVTAQACQ
ncbi:hypothetical protein PHLGIDRAFT_326912 [Phlebiopsis gigantea 11061_1 CR5-6]|uniref:Uncharacterized protein n=1 Tax=Phlebiopsis gigantea (strain 11061_1 CR5-6) TaxID=745531 RepID=A0A0C3PAH6_PHLG1|nr:hypothetical protein PHLGIDRAFT_326912 [Phlebiopsis gigantea 11061_1 CR5-6]